MKKAIIIGAAVVFLCSVGFASMGMAADDKGPAEITLTTKDAKKPVSFPHAAHQARLECDKCHKDANFAPAANEWTKKAGHALCKDCHKANKASTKCSTCHSKK